MKDVYYNDGTTDDVYLSLYKNGESRGFAIAGETSSRRVTGAYTGAMFLERGDVVQTFASADGNKNRHLLHYFMTGYFVR
jgi:hypothetical protein